jgi:putative oxidoreductase
MKNPLVAVTCALLILLFTYTAVSKLIDMYGFAYDMHNQPFPRWFSSALVYLLPALELAIALFLFFGRTRNAALWASLLLMGLFTVYSGLVLLNVFNRVPCSCGGVIKKLSWRQHTVFNLFFVVLISIAIKTQRTKYIHA